MNKNPLWKTLLVLAVLVWGVVYSIPNLYPDAYAVQVSGARGAITVNEAQLQKATQALDSAGIAYKQPELGDKGITIRFDSNEVQLAAQPVIKRALGADYVVALNLVPTTPEWLMSLGASPMKLGLDLRGGVHFLLEVDLEKATQQNLEIALSDLKAGMRTAKIRYREAGIVGGDRIELVFRQESERDEAYDLARREFSEYLIETGSSEKGELVTLQLTEARLREIEDYAVSQNLSTLRNRVNELGVAEPLVQRQGRGRIIVQLPGVQDTAAAKRVLGATANLEFRLEATPDAAAGSTETFKFRSEPRSAVIEKDIIISGASVANASQSFDENGQPQVNIKLDSIGGKKMYRITANAVQRRMAVLFVEHKERSRFVQVNGESVEKRDRYVEKGIISLATIQSPLGSDFRITGLDSVSEAGELALLLRSGALAAPVYFVEERTVGPSLGQKNIEAGVLSMGLGFAFVLVFMVAYYSLFGLVANIALAANVVILMSIMAMLSATLTLPALPVSC
jgi:preprotein translocase subunit SecD